MKTLLIEIGTEEIPAGYIIPALEAFKDSLTNTLDKNRIGHGESAIYGTPRRLALMMENVADIQLARTSTLTGPPEKAGVDANGNPTIAAEKFAEKAGITVADIQVEETPKGRYLTAVIEETCESSRAILENHLSKLILSMPFPKRMRWGSLSISFARPIISLTGLLGDEMLNFTVGNIESDRNIFGHQFMYPNAYPLESADQYIALTESIGVIPDIEKRKARLMSAIEACAKEYDAKVLEDKELVDIVNNLVEYPFPVVGKFDDEFLEVPDEVLITAMREHQKCFALIDDQGRLKPYFIAVNNTRAKDMALVAGGHERVLRARLADAKFFYEQDCKSTLDDFYEKLKKVTFQEKLGSVYEKTRRIEQLGRFLAENTFEDQQEALLENLSRASVICKADLVSQVVIEFTKLQGVIGRVYAQNQGENNDVALSVEHHYRPVRSGGQLPENPTSSLLAIADKLDTICGCFSIDLIPTGGTDPYALRRQGIGIIQILLNENMTLPLSGIIKKGVEPFTDDPAQAEKISSKVQEFLKNRMISMLIEKGFSREAVNSALSASFENLPDALLRVEALDTLRKAPDFEPIATTFKRIENILRKAGQLSITSVQPDLFEAACESQLQKAVTQVAETIEDLAQSGEYEKVLSSIAELRPAVDTFFDDVMVMAEDDNIKNNRLALLSTISELFRHIADFSKL